jgi:CubicO group peptidase (beta-lactamase class C family)
LLAASPNAVDEGMRWCSLVALVAFACSSQPDPVRPPPTVPPAEVVVAPPVDAMPSGAPADASLPIVSPIELPVAPDAALGKRLDAAIDKAIAEQQLVGVVVMVARDGKLVYARAAGLADREAKLPVREDTLFRWASMTKPITAVAALMLVEQGKLGLDDPIEKYLPEYKFQHAGKPAKITVRHLLTHTSGLSYRFIEDPDSAYDKAEVPEGLAHPGLGIDVFLQRLSSVPLKFQPGTQWRYSLSLDVLGEVIARAAKMPFAAVMKEMITRPLGMADTAFAVTDRARLAWPYAEDKGKPPVRMTEPHAVIDGKQTVRFSPARIFDSASFASGGAGLAGTARDYLIFLEAMRRGGAPILKPESVKAMTDNQIGKLSEKTMTPGRRYGFGVGVAMDQKSIAPRGKGTWYWGGIYGTGFWVDPEHKLSVVMLTNVAGDTPFDRWVEKAIFSN